VRAKIKGSAAIPRLSVFRSNKHLWVQLIDDSIGHTIASASDLEVKVPPRIPKDKRSKKGELKGRIAIAEEVGKLIARKAAEKKIKAVVFDRGGYKYHGLVKAVAEGARKAGLKF